MIPKINCSCSFARSYDFRRGLFESSIYKMKTLFQYVIFFIVLGSSFSSAGQSDASPQGVYTEIVIEANATQIWELLIDFANYPEWHTYLTNVKGEVAKGKYLRFTYFDEKKKREKQFRAKILTLTPNEKLSWGGNLWFFFKAEHSFELIKVDETHTKLIQTEYWKGLFGKSFGKKIYQETLTQFEELNEQIKDIVEE